MFWREAVDLFPSIGRQARESNDLPLRLSVVQVKGNSFERYIGLSARGKIIYRNASFRSRRALLLPPFPA